MARPSRPAPPPYEINVTAVVIVGTAAWFVAFLVLLPFFGRLRDAGNEEWVWTCLAGWVLGFLGLLVLRLQSRAGTRDGDPPAPDNTRSADNSRS